MAGIVPLCRSRSPAMASESVPASSCLRYPDCRVAWCQVDVCFGDVEYEGDVPCIVKNETKARRWVHLTCVCQ